jgi:hypothetical protein
VREWALEGARTCGRPQSVELVGVLLEVCDEEAFEDVRDGHRAERWVPANSRPRLIWQRTHHLNRLVKVPRDAREQSAWIGPAVALDGAEASGICLGAAELDRSTGVSGLRRDDHAHLIQPIAGEFREVSPHLARLPSLVAGWIGLGEAGRQASVLSARMFGKAFADALETLEQPIPISGGVRHGRDGR